jgi:hypothetical protein
MSYDRNKSREQLFDKMRNYHNNAFPDNFSTKELTDLRENFRRIEDQTISMTLRVIYGKAEFVDSSQDLTYFVTESTKLPAGDLKSMYVSKIEQIRELLKLAKLQDGSAKAA